MRIGVDLGGSKIEAIALDQTGAIKARRRIPTPREDYDATVRTVASLAQSVREEAGGGGASVGVAIPGAISPATGLVKNANSTWLIGRALEADLAAILGQPVRLANDANCFALSEAIDGAGMGEPSVFGVIVGTGTGGGIVVNERIHEGRHLIAGEWGHNPLPWPDGDEHPGPPCYCGRRGCIETFLSGPGLAGDHMRHGGDGIDAKAIAAMAAAGDAPALATLARYERRMAKALAGLINVLDPAVIVLGGGLSRITRLYDNVPGMLCDYVFSDEVTTPLRPAKHGDSSGVRGAAWLWPLDNMR